MMSNYNNYKNEFSVNLLLNKKDIFFQQIYDALSNMLFYITIIIFSRVKTNLTRISFKLPHKVSKFVRKKKKTTTQKDKMHI